MEVAWVLYIWVMVIGIVLGLLFESIWHFQWPWSTVNIMESVADNFMFRMIWPDCHIGQHEAKFTERTFKKCIEIIEAVFCMHCSDHVEPWCSRKIYRFWFCDSMLITFPFFLYLVSERFFCCCCFVLSLFIHFVVVVFVFNHDQTLSMPTC